MLGSLVSSSAPVVLVEVVLVEEPLVVDVVVASPVEVPHPVPLVVSSPLPLDVVPPPLVLVVPAVLVPHVVSLVLDPPHPVLPPAPVVLPAFMESELSASAGSSDVSSPSPAPPEPVSGLPVSSPSCARWDGPNGFPSSTIMLHPPRHTHALHIRIRRTQGSLSRQRRPADACSSARSLRNCCTARPPSVLGRPSTAHR